MKAFLLDISVPALVATIIVLFFFWSACNAGTLYSNPDAPVGTTGITPYTTLSEHQQTLGLNLIIPTTSRLTIHLAAQHDWYDLSSTEDTPTLRGEEDEITVINVTNHLNLPISLYDKSSWSASIAFTLWVGNPNTTHVIEHETPHVVEWPKETP